MYFGVLWSWLLLWSYLVVAWGGSTTRITEKCILTIEREGEGSTSPEVGKHSYSKSVLVKLEATEIEGWKFSHWEGEVADPTNATTSILMDRSKTVKAVFREQAVLPMRFTLNVQKTGQGTIQPAEGTHQYEEGRIIYLIATPDFGWEFSHWEGEVADRFGSETSTAIDKNKAVKAVFKEVDYQYKEIGVPYTAADGLTVILHDFRVKGKTGSFEYSISYELRNDTTDQAIDEGSFKLFYSDRPGGLSQYGFFGTLFPGDSRTRTYTFEALKADTFRLLQYHHDHFLASEPVRNGLNWKVEY